MNMTNAHPSEQGKAGGENLTANGAEKTGLQHDEAPEASPANRSDAPRDRAWAGDETNGRNADLMKKLAALPKSLEGVDY
ncbi:MAG: hypothetical protein HC767_10835 [Akkermansiaceae bacterium]|nr:hypothetical protein [Akkermansiaceae bacterium]